MKTIVFIGTQKSGSSREAIKAADRLGYYTVLLTDRANFVEKRSSFPDVHLMQLCNLNNIDETKEIIVQLQFKGLDIMSIIGFTDPHCYTACLLCEEFGLNCFSTKAIGNMLNKIDSRKILSNSSYIPYFDVFSNDTEIQKIEIEEHLPIIIKSPNSTGSKDVFKITTFNEFLYHTKKLLEKYPSEPILIEEFLDGPQYLVETIVYENRIHIIAVFKQEITFTGRFIITGYNLMLDLSEAFFSKLSNAVDDIIKAHGMDFGSCHLEMRYVKNRWKLVEINPRISGGAMNEIIEIALGINLVKETLKMSLGETPILEPKYKNYTFTQYIIVSSTGVLEKVTGRIKASKCDGVKSVFIKPKKGSVLTPPLSMGNRYAYVIAVGDTEIKARDNAKYAASLINFSLKPLLQKQPQETIENTVSLDFDNSDICLGGFRKYLIKQKKSISAIKKDIANINIYLKWYKTSFHKECISLEREKFLQYKHALKDILVLSPKTINSKFCSLERFNRYLIEESIQEQMVVSKQDLLKAANKKSKNSQSTTSDIVNSVECK
jgi:biotin carboxylase